MTQGTEGSSILELYESYRSEFVHYRRVAQATESFLRQSLSDAGIGVHAVFARAKAPTDLLEKLRRKRYPNPERDITDLVGARIICYYSDEVDQATDLVQPLL